MGRGLYSLLKNSSAVKFRVELAGQRISLLFLARSRLQPTAEGLQDEFFRKLYSGAAVRKTRGPLFCRDERFGLFNSSGFVKKQARPVGFNWPRLLSDYRVGVPVYWHCESWPNWLIFTFLNCTLPVAKYCSLLNCAAAGGGNGSNGTWKLDGMVNENP